VGTAVGREADAVRFLAALAAEPYNYDFYQTLRQFECLYADKPRWGEAPRPIDEPVRLGQDPDLSFAPAPLAALQMGSRDGRPRLLVRLFGLFGPNGPLPLHLTEYARERLRNAGDPTFARFADVFHHRMLALFYRAWAQGQPHVNRDRPKQDRVAGYVASLLGIMPLAFRDRDSLPDEARLFQAGTLSRHVRNADGLASILRQFFRVPADVEQFIGHWMRLEPADRTYLGRDSAQLGVGAIVGESVWDRQHKFRLQFGPLTLAQYERFLPGGSQLRQVVDWVAFYLSFELDWDMRLLLRHDHVPPLTLHGQRRLGWTTWLGTRRGTTAAGDLCLHPVTSFARIGASVT
jgi:type VI secretion system protein ImpH